MIPLSYFFSLEDGKLYKLDDKNKPTNEVLATIDFFHDDCLESLKSAVEKFKAKDFKETPDKEALERKKFISDLNKAFPEHEFLPCKNDDKYMSDDQLILKDLFCIYNESLNLKIVLYAD